jgi:hypothetical protein
MFPHLKILLRTFVIQPAFLGRCYVTPASSVARYSHLSIL